MDKVQKHSSFDVVIPRTIMWLMYKLGSSWCLTPCHEGVQWSGGKTLNIPYVSTKLK
jgi:hypothetical protein